MAWLGETPYALEDSPFKDWSREDIAMELIGRYGQIDGDHHKLWVLDQVARVLKGSPMVDIRQARWTDHEPEWRWEIGESDEYHAWVREMRGAFNEEEGEYEYGYDEGIAP